MTVVAAPTLHVTKGHGTQNDFVLLDDRDGLVELSSVLVRGLADRRAGVGGDGVIRVVASEHLPEGVAALAVDPEARWFMDYRNADGSVAEMCGNGVRVFAAYLERLGLWDAGQGELALGTRAGVRRVRRVPVPAGVGDDVWYAVDMGPWHLPGGPQAVRDAADAEVAVAGLEVARAGLSGDVGNPHVVLALGDEEGVAGGGPHPGPPGTPGPPHGPHHLLGSPLGGGRPHPRPRGHTGAPERHEHRARRPAGGARGTGRLAGRARPDAGARAGRGGDPLLRHGGVRRRARGPDLGGRRGSRRLAGRRA